MKSSIYAVLGFLIGVALASLYFLTQNPGLREATQTKNETAQRNPVMDAANPCAGYNYDKLPPPKYADKLPKKLETNRTMEVKVAWGGVNGAKGYNIYVEDKGGRLIRKFETKRTFIYLRDIPLPAEATELEYQVRLATVNGAEQAGDKGETRPLKISRQASVMAPTLKKIEVED